MMFSMAMWMAAIVAPLQIVAGDLHGLNTLAHQPAKVAAMEGDFETTRGRTADPVRPARHGSRAHATYADRDPASRQPDPDPCLERRGARARMPSRRQDWPPAPSSSGPSASWSASASRWWALGWWSLWLRFRGAGCSPRPLLHARGAGDGAGGVRRRARRLDHHRGRAAALHRLSACCARADASRRSTRRRRRLARRLRGRLLHRLRRRLLLHPAPDAPGRPRCGRARAGIRACRCAPPASPRCRRWSRTPHRIRRGSKRHGLSICRWSGPALIAFAVLAYVVLDGFDLGVGILFAVEHSADDRDVMMNSVAPVWDGNETWLVLGGGGLFAVFPLAYAIIMPALYPADHRACCWRSSSAASRSSSASAPAAPAARPGGTAPSCWDRRSPRSARG